MVKKIEIFAPDDLEFDFSALNLGKYTMPGDIPTGKVVRMWAMGSKLQNGELEQMNKLKDLICELFAYNHSEEEVDKLRDKLGVNVVYQITNAINEHMAEAQGEEVKNLTNPDKAGNKA